MLIFSFSRRAKRKIEKLDFFRVVLRFYFKKKIVFFAARNQTLQLLSKMRTFLFKNLFNELFCQAENVKLAELPVSGIH